MMRQAKTRYFALMVLIFFLSACIPEQVETPTVGTPLPAVDIDTIEPLVSQPDYLNGCRGLNSSVYNQQVIYMGITPGKTTSLEVKNLMGDPIRVLIDEWTYPAYVIIFDEDVVSTVSVTGYIDPFPLLGETIDIYGCPDIIFAYHLTDDPVSEIPGTLGMVTFVYVRIGVVFVIGHYPVRLSDRVEGANYFVPMSLRDYLFSIKDFLEYPDSIKLVSWDEVVNE